MMSELDGLSRHLTARGGATRRHFLGGLGALSAGLLLTACGGGTPAPAPAPAAPAPASSPAAAPAAPAAASPAAVSAPASSPAAAPAAAAPTAASAGAAARPAGGGTKLVLAQGSEPTTLDPQFEQSGAIGTGLNPMLEHLTEFDRNLNIKNVLAESAQMPTDGVTYRFKLRPNMKFWDGTPVDANAIKFTYERALNPQNRQKGLSDPVPVLQGVDHVNVVDPLTVEVVTGKPSTLAWPFFVQEFILAPQHYGSKSFEETAINPMGSGPWKFVRWVKGDMMEMAANENYWRGKPQIDTLIYRTIPDPGTRLAALERGDVDIIAEINPDDLPIVQANNKLRVESMPTTSRVHIGVPCNVPKWKDRRARQALNYAINVDNIVKFVLLGLPPGRLRTPIITDGWVNNDIQPYAFDQAKAKDLLNAAGFDWSQPVNIYATRGGMKRVDVLQAIASDLQKLGMKAEVQILETSVFNSKLKAQEMDDLYVTQLGAPSYGPVEAALITGDLGLDATRFIDSTENGPKYKELYQEVRTTFDEARQHQIINQLQALLMEEAPWILLYREMYLFGVNKRTDWKPTSYSRLHFWLPDEADAKVTAAS